MASHAREGHKAEGGRRAHDSVAPSSLADAPSQSPLDFALAFMRDTSKPDALRVSVAKAALPYVHGRWCQVDSDPRDAKPKLPPPFDLPDPFGSLRVDWRDALERAGLAPAGSAHEPARVVAPASTNVPQPLVPPRNAGRVDASEASGRVGFEREAPHPPRLRSAPSPLRGEGEDERAAPAPRADMDERARALEQRATLAEGRLREAQHHARDMEQRALAAEALIAGRR